MGIEALNSAARAAGFAMATSDEPESKLADAAEQMTWRPAQAELLDQTSANAPLRPESSLADWFRGVFGAFGRRAPA